MKRLAGIVALGFFLYNCGGGGGLGKPDVHYKDFGIDVSTRASSYLKEENHKDGWGQKDCLACHQISKHTMGTPLYPPDRYRKLIEEAVAKVGKTNAIRVCSACHGNNGVKNFGGRACVVCHDNVNLTHYYLNASKRTRSFHDFNGNGKLDDFDCVVCHWQPDMDGLVELDTDFARFNGVSPSSIDSFCLKCHSLNWSNIKGTLLADTSGDGVPDRKILVKEASPVVNYSEDFHGDNSYGSARSFKSVSVEGKLLYYNPHESLACIVCHNPHSSNNDKLIIEKVGETLTLEVPVKQEDNSATVKKVLIDPDLKNKFNFYGVVNGKDKTYDLSNASSLKEYASLPVLNDNSTTVADERKTLSSLCAACHDGTLSFSPVNGLGLPIDLNGHYKGRCNHCHHHGETF